MQAGGKVIVRCMRKCILAVRHFNNFIVTKASLYFKVLDVFVEQQGETWGGSSNQLDTLELFSRGLKLLLERYLC